MRAAGGVFSSGGLISFRHCRCLHAFTIMKSVLQSVALASVILLAGCGGRGTSAPPPTGLTVTGQDTQITLNWNVTSGAQYRVYCAPGSSVDNYSWYTTVGGVARTSTQQDLVTPPFTVDRLQNDSDYSCTVDARIHDGPAGVSAPSVTTRTRWLGDFRKTGDGWQTAPGTGVNALRALAGGVLSGQTISRLYAAGAAGQVRVSDDGLTTPWTDVSGVPAGVGDLNAAMVFMGRLVVGGTAGVMASSADLSSWATASLGSPIRNIASNGTRLVAVGAAGLIRYSTDGSNWVTPTVVPADLASRDITGIAYSPAGYWVAVGSSGAVLVSTSSDASQWAYASGSAQSADLFSVAVLPVQDPATLVTSYKAVAVGAQGAVGYSTDLSNWRWQNLGNRTLTHVVAGAQTMYKIYSGTNIVAYSGGQFVLAGKGGSLFRSGDGLSWDGASWSDFSASLGTSADPALFYRFVRVNTLGSTTSWMWYGLDGAGRWAR